MSEIDECAAWVGCLACYNAGNLVGQWHDAADLEDWQIPADHNPTHEEWIVMDSEGLHIGELSPDQWFTQWALYKAHMGVEPAPLVVLVELVSQGVVTLGEDTDATIMVFAPNESDASIAFELADNYGVFAQIPEDLAHYFDAERWVRDSFSMERIGGYTVATS